MVILAATSVVLYLGVLCDLSNVEVELRSENFEHYDANAVVLRLEGRQNFQNLYCFGGKSHCCSISK